ncbi:DUF3955 domain-containing protein [Terrisporobacter glycolicus]|uniref:DUF3955 domain-containing protein n=1 Tax=Terrisporobacter glycolicus ATCC 14880 = DSM 1288 TaxID=1121315 RepID=A0ABZ2EWE5_9FIRM|nr:DUF3955 domain-containing protein [Terrisporobacter glycolicus]
MRKYKITLLCLLMTLLCLVSYNLIGSKVLEDGTLQEPFFLIPIAYLFLFTSIINAVFIKIKDVYKLKKHN